MPVSGLFLHSRTMECLKLIGDETTVVVASEGVLTVNRAAHRNIFLLFQSTKCELQTTLIKAGIRKGGSVAEKD